MPGWINREYVFTAISLAIAAIFGWGFFSVAGIPPIKINENWSLLVIFIFFLIIPFAQKVDFFQLFSFEAKISEVKKEVIEAKAKVADVREDVRHIIAQQNSLSASIQSMNHQAVTINNYDRPRDDQVEAATAELADVNPVEFTGPKAFEKLNLSEQVALLRVRVERELRRLYEPYRENESLYNQFPHRPHAPLPAIVRILSDLHPSLRGHTKSFSVFFRIANAAVHSYQVPSEDLHTAIYLGERLLGLLTDIKEDPPLEPELPLAEPQ